MNPTIHEAGDYKRLRMLLESNQGIQPPRLTLTEKLLCECIGELNLRMSLLESAFDRMQRRHDQAGK